MMKARRVDRQDDGGGLHVKAKCRRHLLQNISDVQREHKNFKKEKVFVRSPVSPAALHLTAPSCSITFTTDGIKLLPDIFKVNLVSTNAQNDCFLLRKHIFDNQKLDGKHIVFLVISLHMERDTSDWFPSAMVQ